LNSVLSFLRQDAEHFHELVVIANLTPVPRLQYRVGLPRPGQWRELLNSDAAIYGGSNMGNGGRVTAADKPCHRQPYSAEFILPPLSILVFRPERGADKVVTNVEAAPERTPERLRGTSPALGGAESSAPVPPHPDPLPQREGTAKAGARQNDDDRFAAQQATIPPLPFGRGEGRGEGKGTEENAPETRADSQPVLPRT
jgi:hypothetical protein